MIQDWLDGWVQYYRSKGPVILLESQTADHPAGNICYLAALPEATIKAWGNRIEIRQLGGYSTITDDPWHVLSNFYKKWNDWLFGYLGYDLKNHIEVLYSENRDVVRAPDLFFMKPGLLLKINLENRSVYALKGDKPEKISYTHPSSKVEVNNLHSSVSEKRYRAIIEAAKRQIYEGIFYEINLSHQLEADFRGAPFQLYRKMREAGPVPFGAYIQFDDYAVCCLSPELFLSKKSGKIFSQPIKGTIKRHQNSTEDHELVNRLTTSTKNRAENLMIVDLVRNDLSKIACPGSVNVSNLFEIQTFDTLHQMVSTVYGSTQIKDPFEIIKACYPMGSMTGAPKISVMKAIEQFENYRRGMYSGSIGYISPNGDFDFNVVIRTAIIHQSMLYYAVGGAITSDSDSGEEWRETWLKAEALRKVIDNKDEL